MKSVLQKILIFILVLSFVFSTALFVSAEEEEIPAVITVENVSGKPGETVTLSLTVSDNPGFAAFTFGFDFDSSAFEVVNASHDSDIGGQSNYKTRLVWFRSGDFTGNGVIAEITVKISENAAGGKYPFDLSYVLGDFSNFNEDNVPLTVIPGSITVERDDQPDASDVFDDVKPEDWFCPYVTYVYNAGLMKGTSSTRFSPGESMSRAMLVTVLWRVEGSPVPGVKAPFLDLSEDWYRNAVVWAYENEIVKGVTETLFSPNSPLTREQIAAIFFRYAGFKGRDVSVRGDLGGFPDLQKVSGYAVESMAYAVGSGLIAGDKGKDGLLFLNPLGKATRAQVATILQRFLTK